MNLNLGVRIRPWASILLVSILMAADPSVAMPTNTLALRDTDGIGNSTEEFSDGMSEEGFHKGYFPGPTTRGTVTIIFTCCITLFLCIWTTVQVNIEPNDLINNNLFKVVPPLQNRKLGKLLASRIARKLGWSCITLIVPEATLAVAAYERATAKYLHKNISQPDWDMTVCYYAIMGGFVITPPASAVSRSQTLSRRLTGQKALEDVEANGRDYSDTQEPAVQSGNEKGTMDTHGLSAPEATESDGVETHVPSAPETNEKNTVDAHVSLRPETNDKVSVDTKSTPAIDTKPKPSVDSHRPGSAEVKRRRLHKRIDNAVARFREGENLRRTLTPQGVYLIHKKGLLPKITAEEVMDKNKASKLTKGIVFFQALWMIVQVIGRVATDLPVTLIELHTCLHTFCAVAMYAVWWNKPVDINLPTNIQIDDIDLFAELCTDNSKDEDARDVQKKTSPLQEHSAGIRYLTTRAGLGKLLYIDLFGDDLLTTKSYFQTLANGYMRLWKGRALLWKEAVFISIVGVVYGGVHLAAWCNKYPSYPEQMLWRVAAAITAVSWLGFVMSLYLGRKEFMRTMCGVLFGVCISPCLFVRVFLLVESFVSLRGVDMRSYEIARWSQLWPHAG